MKDEQSGVSTGVCLHMAIWPGILASAFTGSVVLIMT